MDNIVIKISKNNLFSNKRQFYKERKQTFNYAEVNKQKCQVIYFIVNQFAQKFLAFSKEADQQKR